VKSDTIEINDMTKTYRTGKDSKKAVDDLSCSINRGEIFGLVGPNGAGKTTTIKLIVGLLKQDTGTISIFGKDNQDIETKKLIGYLPENPVCLNYLSGKEFLKYVGELYKIEPKVLKDKIYEIANSVGITEYMKKKVSTYSKGMIQRLFLAQTLIANPELLILDEPTSGLDPLGIIEFRNILQNLKKEGKTVILCSHYLTELEKTCDTVAFLKKGKILKTVELIKNKSTGLEELFLEYVGE
jgi:ABC-2 type transport system ATP-binding protein